MLGTPANLIKQVEKLTTSSRPDDVIRLRNGKLATGKFRGTARQRFHGLLVKLFIPHCEWKTNFFLKQRDQFESTTTKEAESFSQALTKEISKRTVVPCIHNTSLSVEECQILLNNTAPELQQFNTIVDDITNAVLHPSPMVTNKLDSAKKIATTAINNKTLCRTSQMQQLRMEVNQALTKAGIDKRSRQDLDTALDDETIKLALFSQAREYALSVYDPGIRRQYSSAGTTRGIPAVEDIEKNWDLKRSQTKEEREQSFSYKSTKDISLPVQYDNIQVLPKDAVERTITMLKNAYPSLVDKSSVPTVDELRGHLTKFLSDRKVEPVDVNPTFSPPLDTTPPGKGRSDPWWRDTL